MIKHRLWLYTTNEHGSKVVIPLRPGYFPLTEMIDDLGDWYDDDDE